MSRREAQMPIVRVCSRHFELISLECLMQCEAQYLPQGRQCIVRSADAECVICAGMRKATAHNVN